MPRALNTLITAALRVTGGSPVAGESLVATDGNGNMTWGYEPAVMVIALSDEATAITTGTAKVTIRAPFAMQITQIPRASLSTVSTSGNPTVDVNVGGTSILGANKLSIDANELTSTTAATATTLAANPTSVADDAQITFDVDTAGTGAKGLKVHLYYTRV